MKKIFKLLLAVILMLGLIACNKNNGGNGGNDKPEEPVIKGVTKNAGRFDVLVPEGWTLIDMGEYSDTSSAVLLKGTQDDWMKVPQLSIMYFMPTELVVSGAALYENVIQQPSFTKGDYNWKAWTGSLQGLNCYAVETEGDFGFITVYLQQVTENGDIMSIDDPEVGAIIQSIVPKPLIEVDWIRFENGKAIVQLPTEEGYIWDEVSSVYKNGVEGQYEINDGILTCTATGNGHYGVSLQLVDEDHTRQLGEASFSLKLEDDKFVGVYDAKVEIYDEPIENGEIAFPDETDYELIDQILVGAWADEPNGLTMSIQRNEEIEHGYIITIHSSEKAIVASGHVEEGGTLWYEEVVINATEKYESMGWFMLDGDALVWGHDEAVGEYDNISLFHKVQ